MKPHQTAKNLQEVENRIVRFHTHDRVLFSQETQREDVKKIHYVNSNHKTVGVSAIYWHWQNRQEILSRQGKEYYHG